MCIMDIDYVNFIRLAYVYSFLRPLAHLNLLAIEIINNWVKSSNN